MRCVYVQEGRVKRDITWVNKERTKVLHRDKDPNKNRQYHHVPHLGGKGCRGRKKGRSIPVFLLISALKKCDRDAIRKGDQTTMSGVN